MQALDHGDPVDLGPPKQRALLALLLINAGHVVPVDKILEELWADEGVDRENTLWTHVSRLRTALDPDRGGRRRDSILIRQDPGYLLAIEPEQVDVFEFERLLTQGRAAVLTDPGLASAVLNKALGLWRGRPLEDFAYMSFAQSEISRLEEQRLLAIESRIEADLASGQAREVVSELEALSAEHPLRERITYLLMLSLYRTGRQADALRAYERCRRAVGSELGIEPAAELRRLEERILLQDESLLPHGGFSATGVGDEAVLPNPYKGLRAFQESDAENFFGRDALVAELMRRLTAGDRLVAVVGPSGSGKSSVVRSGLLPVLRKQSGDEWVIASMMPGAHPFAELEAALLRSTLDAPDSLAEQVNDKELGLLRAALRVLPDEESQLLLVIDQFEELFTLVDDEATRSRFLDNLLAALDDPRGRIRALVTLRADLYDRPLLYPDFARLLTSGLVHVLPLSPEELEAAATRPAARFGVVFDDGLLAELIADVAGRPGALPLFQYTLTELFDRRDQDHLTMEAYETMGGLRGALAGRAEQLYGSLGPEEQEAAQQLFLRLVAVGDESEHGRRRVKASEITSLEIDTVAMQAVLEAYGDHRMLSFDRDQSTGAPTVEVAHEALLREWPRLRDWIEEARDDVLRHGMLVAALDEWARAGKDAGYLLAGTRLAQYEAWASTTSMRLTTAEREFLEASVAQRVRAAETESERAVREERLARRSRRRLWGLAAAVAALAIIGVVTLVALLSSPGPRVALVFDGRGDRSLSDLNASGLDRAVEDFAIQPEEFVPIGDMNDELSLLSERSDLVVAGGSLYSIEGVAEEHPATKYAQLDTFVDLPNVASYVFASEEGSFLVGAAAAMHTRTGVVGFVGGIPSEVIESFRAGFEAGAKHVRPDIETLAIFVSYSSFQEGFERPDLARTAARTLFQEGADVVYTAAGNSEHGVFEAAKEQTDETGVWRWAIGADSDHYYPAADDLRPHILTSMIKRFDLAVYEAIRAFVEDEFEATEQEFRLEDDGLDFSRSGGFIDDDEAAELENLKERIVSGEIVVPTVPTGPVIMEEEPAPTVDLDVAFDGTDCIIEGPSSIPTGEVLGITFENSYSSAVGMAFVALVEGTTTADIVIRGPASSEPPEWVAWWTFAADLEAEPGGSDSLVAQPPPGDYVALCLTGEDDTDRAYVTDIITITE